MSIAAFAISMAPVSLTRAAKLGGQKPPPKRTVAVGADLVITPEPR